MRKTRLSDKEVREISTVENLKNTRDSRYGRLINYAGNGSNVEMWWDMNPQAKKDQIFKLRIGNEYAYIDNEQLQKLTRWI